MEQSLNQQASQILNAVYAGLKSPANFSISKEQIKDEIAQERNFHAKASVESGAFSAEPFRQTIPKLAVAKKDFSGVDGYTSGRKEYFAVIPEVLMLPGIRPVHYVSTMGKTVKFKVIYGDEFFHVLHDKFSCKAPTIWIKDRELWLLNPPIANIQHITVRAIFENPRAINGVGGIKFIDDDPYPMPSDFFAKIRNKLVNDYINQYRRGNLQPILMASDAIRPADQ